MKAPSSTNQSPRIHPIPKLVSSLFGKPVSAIKRIIGEPSGFDREGGHDVLVYARRNAIMRLRTFGTVIASISSLESYNSQAMAKISFKLLKKMYAMAGFIFREGTDTSVLFQKGNTLLTLSLVNYTGTYAVRTDISSKK